MISPNVELLQFPLIKTPFTPLDDLKAFNFRQLKCFFFTESFLNHRFVVYSRRFSFFTQLFNFSFLHHITPHCILFRLFSNLVHSLVNCPRSPREIPGKEIDDYISRVDPAFLSLGTFKLIRGCAFGIFLI